MLQMALLSFLWLSTAPLYVCAAASLSIPLSMDPYFLFVAMVNSLIISISLSDLSLLASDDVCLGSLPRHGYCK